MTISGVGFRKMLRRWVQQVLARGYTRSDLYPVVVGLLLGAAMPLGFAPFELFWLPPVLLAGLFFIWLDTGWRQTLLSGFCFGLGMFGTGVSWVFISLETFGDMPLLLAFVCVAGFVAYLSLFPMLAAMLQYGFRSLSVAVRLVVIIPTAWVAMEISRGYVFTGFSWLEVGYSQVGWGLSAWAPLLGVHGVSLLTTLFAGGLVYAVLGSAKGRFLMTAFMVVLVSSSWGWSQMDWTRPSGTPIRAALIQANIPLETKWNLAEGRKIGKRYIELSRQSGDVDLHIWPESALPFFIDQMGDGFYDAVTSLGAPLLAGFLERRPRDDAGFRYYNSAILFDNVVQIYRKRHLVPFGEYTPLEFLFAPIIDYFDVPMSDMSTWDRPQKSMSIAGRAAGVSICYEDAFPRDIRSVAEHSDFLINISEDAWFGNSLGPHQRLQMARMRSLETGRPMFRASNTGLAAMIDYRGNLVAVSPQFEPYMLEGKLQPRNGQTPYMWLGDWPLLGILLFSLGLAVWARSRSNQQIRI